MKAGYFVKNGVNGNQAITGLGFRPRALIFWTTGPGETPNTWDADISSCVGVSAGGAGQSRSISAAMDDNSGAPRAYKAQSSKAIIIVDGDGNTDSAADMASFDADGFTLDWTTNDGGQQVVLYLAFGPSDVTQAAVLTWNTPVAAGPQSVTGVGFRPDAALHLAIDFSGTAADTAVLMVGVMCADGSQWADTVYSLNTSTTDTQRIQQTDACYVSISSTPAVDTEGAFASMDADGFTVDFSTVASGGRLVASLCLKGLDAHAGAFDKTTAAAPTSQAVTGVGFRPSAVILASHGTTAGGATSHAAFALGFSDGDDSLAGALIDRNAVNPSQADAIYRDDSAALVVDTGPLLEAAAAVASLDADGFTLDWTTNSGTADQLVYLALLGNPAVPPLRLFPRDDATSLGHTPRLFPPPRSRQQSERLHPSYW